MSDEEVQINQNKGKSDEGSEDNLEETIISESEVSHTTTEDVTLDEVKGMDTESLRLLLEHKERMHQERLRMQLEVSERQHRYRLEFEQMKLNNEMKMKELEVGRSHSPVDSEPEEVKYKGPTMPRFNEGDDIDAYLHTFEKLAEAYKWKEDTWATRLAALISGKALEAYARMERTESLDYQKVKRAILQRYELTSETYRRKFRTCKRKTDETFREWSVRISRYNDQWWEAEDIPELSRRSESTKQLRDLLLREQLIESSPEELKIWLKERKPKSLDEMVTLADQYLTSRVVATAPRLKPSTPAGTQQSGKENVRETRKCYICDKRGHLAVDCRQKKNKPYNGKKAAFVYQRKLDPELKAYRIKGKVNGKAVMMLRDTGCTTTLVHSSLIPKRALISDDKITVYLADGSQRKLQMANCFLEVDSKVALRRVGVVEHLTEEVLLGNDIAQEVSTPSHAMVTTRAQAKGHLKESKRVNENIKKTKVKSKPLLSIENEDGVLEGLFMEKECQSLEEKDKVLDMTPSTLQEMQKGDETLKELFGKVEKKNVRSDESYFFIRNGLLFRSWLQGKEKQERREQLVVPKKCRSLICKVAHDIPLSGHLGIDKTTARISRNFYWPGMHKDISEYCNTCDICQKAAKKTGHEKSPLVSVPVVGIPFSKVAIDLVGPLPKSSRGNRYILVLVDYATRYPEAIALSSIDTKTIAEQLVQVFSRVGLPDELLSDQGSNFTSELMKDVCRLLNIRKLRTSAYHPMANGLVERFNGTLKSMLRKFVDKNGSNWDSYLPYLLFAYREVPQASTGFSPFELLYGRKVRGPLDLIFDTWTESQKSEDNVVQYILDMREKLKEMSDIAMQSLEVEQKKQKQYYDRKTRERHFSPGDKVLILLPSSTNKLHALWKGPYRVIKRLSDVDYQVQVGGNKGLQTYHLNMMRPFKVRQEQAFLCTNTMEDESEELPFESSPVTSGKETWRDVRISDTLTDEQREEVEKLLCEFQHIFTDAPGRTSMIKHKVELKEDKTSPIRQKPYRIPESKKEEVKQELDKMLKEGIIEESYSDWASPIVLVPKKDGTKRFCVDFRKLNAVCKYDAYPIPRMDDILEKIAPSKYLSNLDLAKGYWQIELDEASKELTAFVTPFGLYQFKMMPFGLNAAPSTFARLMRSLLRGQEEFCDAYFDDTTVFSKSWMEHLTHLRETFQRISDAGLTVRPTKCVVGAPEIEMIGHVVGNGKIRTKTDKVETIKKYPRPSSKKELRAFLGLVGYYRKFVKDFANISLPLTDLTRKGKNVTIDWNDKCEVAFNQLKDVLLKKPVLTAPDFNKSFSVQVDASDKGIGAVLSQVDEEGEEHPVQYLSRKLLDREVRYPTVEKECLAIVWAINQLRYYLCNREFTIVTDHRPLTWLERVKDKNQKLLRWSLVLQQYKFNILHKQGKENLNADALSRAW